MRKEIVIGIGILLLVCCGLLIGSNITGNVITGSVATKQIVENEYFKIDNFDSELNKEEIKNDTQNSSGSR